jgi:hypothetical protein
MISGYGYAALCFATVLIVSTILSLALIGAASLVPDSDIAKALRKDREP